MRYKIIFDLQEYTDDSGHHPEEHKEFNIPFQFYEKVWYCYRERKKYVVRKSRITGIWATNMVGVTLDNDDYVGESLFNRIFKNRTDAVDWCLKQNQKGTVKIYE